MEISRRTWTATVKLAAVLSVVAAVLAVGITQLAEVPQVAVVVPVIIVAFAASWVQTARIRREAVADLVIVPARISTLTGR